MEICGATRGIFAHLNPSTEARFAGMGHTPVGFWRTEESVSGLERFSRRNTLYSHFFLLAQIV